MCLAQGPQRSDAGEARTRGPSDASPWKGRVIYIVFPLRLSVRHKILSAL